MDLLYTLIEKSGRTKFEKLDLTRKPATISKELIEQLYSKAHRNDRSDLTKWLPNYFDDFPIGPATYVVRWNLFKKLKKLQNSKHPMHDAWVEYSPKAIELIEFVMDIRKGDWTDAQIQAKMENINAKMKEIKKAQEDGCWFAKTVVTGSIKDITGFVRKFKTLQSYLNFVTYSKPSGKISDLLDEK